MAEWPIEVQIGVHGDKSAAVESVREALEEEGVDVDEWLKENNNDCAYLGYEVILYVLLYEDGGMRITGATTGYNNRNEVFLSSPQR